MMKTKLLYVLVSSPEDNYLEMAHISITSAKYYMPDCHVVLLVDDQTDRLMDDDRRKILKNVDEYVGDQIRCASLEPDGDHRVIDYR